MRWAGHVACMGQMRFAYVILVPKPEEKKPLGRHRHRWEIWWEDLDWIYLAQYRVQWRAIVNTVMNLRVP
jgi:hypothetical protein